MRQTRQTKYRHTHLFLFFFDGIMVISMVQSADATEIYSHQFVAFFYCQCTLFVFQIFELTQPTLNISERQINIRNECRNVAESVCETHMSNTKGTHVKCGDIINLIEKYLVLI